MHALDDMTVFREYEPREKRCRGCDKPLQFPPSILRTRVWCSSSCRHAATRATYTCEGCGAERTVPQSQTAKRFCGDPCRLAWFARAFTGVASPHWAGGGINYYGPSWRAARAAIRARDAACQRCGAEPTSEALSVAHIIPFREFGHERHTEANAPSNLTGLCRRCHITFDWESGVRS